MDDTAPIRLHPAVAQPIAPLRPYVDEVAHASAAAYAALSPRHDRTPYSVTERIVVRWCWTHWKACPKAVATLSHPHRRAVSVNVGHL